MTWMQHDFLSTLGMKLKEGREFESPADSLSVLINESAAKAMKLENPLAEKITFEGDSTRTKYSIIGVLEDYNYTSLQYKSGPLMAQYCKKGDEAYMYIRTISGDMKERVAEIESVWGGMMDGQPFEYQYLDNKIERLYQNEKRLSGLFGYFAFLAIFISCLGLLGLVSYTIETRTKEIGIRKVLGASVGSIIQLVSKDFVMLVGIAMLISIPTGAYLMSIWLENFAYRISLAEHWYVFLEAIGIAILISILTIGSQAFSITKVNPVNILKDQ